MKYLERDWDSVPDEPFDPGGRSIWSPEKRLWIPKIFAPWENKSKTGDSFT